MNWWTLGFVLFEVILLITAKFVLNIQLHPYYYISIISLITSLELLIFLKITNRIKVGFWSLKTIKSIVPSSLFIGLASAFGFLSIKLTTATNYALINKTTTLMSPLLAFIILREPVNWLIFPIALVVLFGIWLLTGNLEMIFNLSGDSLALITTIFVALDFVYQKKAAIKGPSLTVAFWRRFLSGLMLAILWLVTPDLGQSSVSLLPLLLVVSVGYFFVSIFMVKAVKSQPVTNFNLMINITPVIVMVSAFFLLGEKLNSRQWFGALIILFAIAGYNLINKYDSGRNSSKNRMKR